MPSAPVRSPVRKHYVVAGVLAVVILLAGAVATVVRVVQGAGGDASDSASATGLPDDPATPSPSPSPTAVDSGDSDDRATLPTPPPKGACWRLTLADLSRAVNESARTSCSEPHTARTIAVEALDARVLDDSGADAPAVAKQAGAQCDRAFTSYVGGDTEDRRLSRLQPVWFTAGERAIAAGARWVRCDVVAYETDDRLAALPGALRGVLDRIGGTELGLCSTAAPQAEAARNVMCSQPHTWRAFSVIPLGERRWPGVPAVRSEGDERCSKQARVVQGSPSTWRYGWQWPTQKQWQSGRSYGYCWVPEA